MLFIAFWGISKGEQVSQRRTARLVQVPQEIDLIIEQDNTLYPIEIKKTANPSQGAAKHFSVLDKLNKNIGIGTILCLKQIDVPISRQINAIPISYI